MIKYNTFQYIFLPYFIYSFIDIRWSLKSIFLSELFGGPGCSHMQTVSSQLEELSLVFPSTKEARGPERPPLLRNISWSSLFFPGFLHSYSHVRGSTRVFQKAVWNIFIMIFQAIFDCMDFTGWLLFGFALLLLTDVVRNWRPHNLPPGPWALPFLGNVFTGVDFKTMDKVRWTLTLHRECAWAQQSHSLVSMTL